MKKVEELKDTKIKKRATKGRQSTRGKG